MFSYILFCFLFYSSLYNYCEIISHCAFDLHLFIYLIILCWVGVHCGIYKSIKMYQIFHTWIHLFHHSSLSPLPSIPRIASTGIIFTFTYMFTQHLYHTHPPTHFLHHHFPTTGTNHPSPGKDQFCFPVLWFCRRKKKKMTFLFVYGTYPGSFLVTFPCIYVL
jgi:hypothetical protein